MAEIGPDISEAKRFLDSGKLVAIPTETVYGLAGNALDPVAVASIFETKNRPSFDPLIIHLPSLDKITPYVSGFPDKLRLLAEAFWPGPLTLLLPRADRVHDLVTSGLPRVAVRVPDHRLTLSLLESLDYPLAAPSANPFGYISPTTAYHVADQLGPKIPYILDGGTCGVGLESTIVGIEEDRIVVYRLGGLDLAEIEHIVGPVAVKDHSSSNPQAPGLLESHYAPGKPFIIGDLDDLAASLKRKKTDFAVLSFNTRSDGVQAGKQLALSGKSDIREAAANLFSVMRKLDETDAEVIIAELLPEKGLGRAINDRLKRAAVKS